VPPPPDRCSVRHSGSPNTGGEKLPWPPERGPFAGDDTPIEFVVATLHPSAILRADPSTRERDYQGLVDDLRLAAG
jgi:uracil-DNA glycosylase